MIIDSQIIRYLSMGTQKVRRKQPNRHARDLSRLSRPRGLRAHQHPNLQLCNVHEGNLHEEKLDIGSIQRGVQLQGNVSLKRSVHRLTSKLTRILRSLSQR
jgi:hypothetical protein